MRKGQINHFFILLHILTESCFPVSFRTPFPVMFENGDERWRIPGKKMSHREQTPLAATLKFIKNGVDYFDEVKLADISTFLYTKIGYHSIFYCIFVEYSVFGHWFNILQFGDHNIVHPLRNALYFNYFTSDLTFVH